MIKQKKNNGIQIGLLMILIIVLPALSVMVNFSGRKTGKNFYDEIRNNLGTIKSVTAKDINGVSANTEIYKGKVIVITELTPTNFDSLTAFFKIVNRIDQFKDEVDNLQFIACVDSNATVQAHHYFDNLLLSDKERWLMLNAKPTDFNLTFPNNCTTAIVDTLGVIRRYYDLSSQTDKKKFVEHLSVMPNQRKKGNVVKRDQKKS